MVITETPKVENKSLFEVLSLTGKEGLDICDDIWDWGIYLGCERSFENCKDDYYDKCMLLFALNFTCTKVCETGYSTCLVSKFIHDNIDVFREFFNEENREGYRPMDYDNADDWESDDGFYEAYMQPMESLIAGNYTDSDYKKQ